MRDGVDRYYQEDQTLGKYNNIVVSLESRQGSVLLCRHAEANGDVSVITEVGMN
jgi:hypothetical protein